MKPVQLPDWGDHLWFIEVEPRKRKEITRIDAQNKPMLLNGEPIIDVQYSGGKYLRDKGADGQLLGFASEEVAQAYIDKQQPVKAAKVEPVAEPEPEKKPLGRPPAAKK